MIFKIGIIGLPNVGKTTLFNSLTNEYALSGNYFFTTINPNIGYLNIINDHFNVLSHHFKNRKIRYPQLQVHDIAGLIKNAHQGMGLGNQFLGHLQGIDVLIHVLRCYKDESVLHVENQINPIDDLETVNLELFYSDLEKIDNLQRKSKNFFHKMLPEEKNQLLQTMKLKLQTLVLQKITPTLNKIELEFIKHYNLLSFKPQLILVNHLTEQNNDPEIIKLKDKFCSQVNGPIIYFDPLLINERDVFTKLIKKVGKTLLDILKLGLFFTINETQIAGWIFESNMNIKECAGIIHSDFQNKFIVGEVININALNSFSPGLQWKLLPRRKENKQYLVKNGDICYFLTQPS